MFRPRSLSGEVLILASLSLAAALLVNGLRGQSGLDLGRDYFPADSIAAEPGDGLGDAAENGENAGKPQHGYTSFNLADAQDYQQYLDDQDGVMFLDARSEKLFEAGHIPGARLCHHYRQDQFIPAMLEELRAADIIVIYCAGGDCEDSIQLATDLVFTHGLTQELIAIFEGGFAEWVDAGLAVRAGKQP
jgi:rhodanese-related sulfurtransferase